MKSMSRRMFIAYLRERWACDEAMGWVLAHTEASPAELWEKCRVHHWMTWLIGNAFGNEDVCTCCPTCQQPWIKAGFDIGKLSAALIHHDPNDLRKLFTWEMMEAAIAKSRLKRAA